MRWKSSLGRVGLMWTTCLICASVHAQTEPGELSIAVLGEAAPGECTAVYFTAYEFPFSIELYSGPIEGTVASFQATIQFGFSPGSTDIQFAGIHPAPGISLQTEEVDDYLVIRGTFEGSCGDLSGGGRLAVLDLVHSVPSWDWIFLQFHPNSPQLEHPNTFTPCGGSSTDYQWGCDTIDLNDPHSPVEPISAGAVKARF